ncbi:dUTP diphosphatase [Candidatus Woesearchaeota archaeon]|nr:dUTP diphosphatase [Candidatus Woesearchaeota archaeon]
MTLHIKKLSATATIPKYIHPHDAGMDLYSDETINIQPGERKLIPTGIAMAIPSGYVGLIWDRSGLAAKHGIKSMGGVIDANYRGEIKVILHNLSDTPFTVEKGMRIAQLLIQPIEKKKIVEVEELDATERAEQGFGSTGTR